MTTVARPYLSAGGILVGLTLLTATVVAAVPGLAHAARTALGFDVTGPPHAQSATAIFAHNARAVAGVLLGALAANKLRRGRMLLDAALVAFAAINATAVGATLGAYGTPAAARLSHLPLEYGALTIAGGNYLAHRHNTPRPAPFALTTVSALALLAGGALLESHAL